MQAEYCFTHDRIDRIEVHTFAQAATLNTIEPQNSDQAQYSMHWAMAAALVDGELGLKQILPDRLEDREIISLAHRIEMRIAPDIQEHFPEQCLARVTVVLRDGRRLDSATTGARGDFANPLSDEELNAKFDSLVIPTLGIALRDRLVEVLETLEQRPAGDLLRLLAEKGKGSTR